MPNANDSNFTITVKLFPIMNQDFLVSIPKKKKKRLEQIQSDMNECRPLAHLEQSVSVFLLLLFCFFFRVFAQL